MEIVMNLMPPHPSMSESESKNSFLMHFYFHPQNMHNKNIRKYLNHRICPLNNNSSQYREYYVCNVKIKIKYFIICKL